MKTMQIRPLALLCAYIVLYIPSAFAAKNDINELAAQEKGAQLFVQKMTDNGLKFLSDKSLTKAQKEKSFKTLLHSNFDLNSIGKFAVGTHWRKMSAAQQKEYMTLFKRMLVNVYSGRFDEYQGQKVVISDTINLSEKDSLVKSTIVSSDGAADVPVNWRVRHKNGKYKVIDVMVAGISMSITQRSDFSSVIQRGGGDVDTLIAHLKN